MATTPTTRVTALSRRMRVDIDTATYPASQYQQLMGKQELKLIEELRTVDGETYEDEGAARDDVTGYSWRVEGKILHSTNAAGTAVDPVHLFLRQQFELAKGGAHLGEFGIRWYDRNGLDDGNSKEGRAYVKAWPPEGGSPGAQDVISVVIQGQGPLASITNPNASLLPAVTGLSPATGAAAGGELINVYGTHFTGATDVDFASDAADFVIVSDSHIVAVAPAHAAGTVQVKVTNAAGVSPNVTADDYVYTA